MQPRGTLPPRSERQAAEQQTPSDSSRRTHSRLPLQKPTFVSAQLSYWQFHEGIAEHMVDCHLNVFHAAIMGITHNDQVISKLAHFSILRTDHRATVVI